MQSSRIELCFAKLKDPVNDKLKRFELLARSARRISSPPSTKPSALISTSAMSIGGTATRRVG
ncbi:MAG: hypothetical protein WDN46_25615 [Methylocella sp.]